MECRNFSTIGFTSLPSSFYVVIVICITFTFIENIIRHFIIFAFNHHLDFKELKRSKNAYYIYSDIYHFYCSSFFPEILSSPFSIISLPEKFSLAFFLADMLVMNSLGFLHLRIYLLIIFEGYFP